jgi:hypothetical protein
MFVWYVFYPKWFKTSTCFITTAFQLCLRICHWKVQENQVGLKSRGTYHLLVYADDVSLLGDNTEITKTHTQNFH